MVRPEPPEQRAVRVRRVLPAPREVRVPVGLPDQRVPLVLPVLAALRDRQVRPVLRVVQALQDLPDRRVLQVLPVRVDLPAQQALLAPQAVRVPPGQRV